MIDISRRDALGALGTGLAVMSASDLASASIVATTASPAFDGTHQPKPLKFNPAS